MEMKKFNNIREFAQNKTINKVIYDTMEYSKKRELKNYIYNLDERNNNKDLIWEFLNEPVDSDYYVYVSTMVSSYIRWNNDKNNN